MKSVIKYIFIFECYFLCFCNNEVHKKEEKVMNKIKQEVIPMSHFASTFNYPVGVKNNGQYISKTDGKEYKGWYIATNFLGNNEFGIHPGEDWNGLGGENTDAFQPVYAIANGTVKSVDILPFTLGKAIMIEHIINESTKIDTLYSVYVHVDSIRYSVNEKVNIGDAIAQIFSGAKDMPAHLHFEIRKSTMKNLPLLFYPSFSDKKREWIEKNYYNPSSFISNRKNNEHKK